MATVLLLNGPNLNMLGIREPGHYGSDTLENIENNVQQASEQLGHRFQSFQSNIEGELVNRIHQAFTDKVDFILINPAAYTHTSVAMRDALLSVSIPFYEIHLSNVYKREPFRHKSYFSDIAEGVISGLGSQGYIAALHAADIWLKTNNS